MASPCKSMPPGPTCESNGLSENGPIPKKDIAKPTKKNKPLRPTITAIRIPADGTLPYLIVLELVKASSDYHFNLYDSTLVHHSKTRCMRDPGCRCIQFHNPLADHAELGENPLYDSGASVYDKATCSREELECDYSPNAFTYGNGYGTLLDVPLVKKTEEPHLTFTHATLRLQPNVAAPYWRSGEAWNQRAFQRLHANPREGADLEMMTGEYHIMYTRSGRNDLLPNLWARHRILGDAFVLKMASGTNEEGDWYYEDIPPEILHCSLGNQCLETLRSVRPNTYRSMVGERGNGPLGLISPETELRGMVAYGL